ncbi:NADH-quinone oxidoreductase subunit J [Acinetobacter radioresistens]|jgi:NADH-quinone oxidoreductase subunit J|uniref:NADH-quinone oxidoreductase subunit J n=3 Tax=Moraxellaceae TaxID=468 RepID=A0A8H2PRS8_ACIRA|nr:NADH-quinone oxidoreductase subunit J [Acinetobacter radioresistens]EXB33191.1 NADH-quinone oxidoreductase subunit J [Acinetobacter sp. 1461402]EXB71776.1 NADH-quinone oxidoreductase subunit J [Acinetobacter sp. 230853]EXC33873.1 NADH-quinone oxidoreductase subunit J [Acinetobacter sp. 869535]EXE15393.1 NADH-quinone oxidoreductase subunit J [Acinetobacter sp. 983759]KCX36983.1 NADH-quinone oxidoreductase subunit J [Acinetobacter sp. 263903-1]
MMWPFYLMALVAIISTIRVVTNTNPVHALLSLIVSLLAVAGIFLIVGAPFAGALEVIVYAGAIMVLFVFVVMMLNLGQQTMEQERKWLNSSAWAYPALMSFLMGLILVWMLGGEYTTAGATLGREVIGPKAVGQSLFTHYLLLVEVAAMLLLASLVAAFHIGRREPGAEEENNNG